VVGFLTLNWSVFHLKKTDGLTVCKFCGESYYTLHACAVSSKIYPNIPYTIPTTLQPSIELAKMTKERDELLDELVDTRARFTKTAVELYKITGERDELLDQLVSMHAGVVDIGVKLAAANTRIAKLTKALNTIQQYAYDIAKRALE
jgi:hypothetical protein